MRIRCHMRSPKRIFTSGVDCEECTDRFAAGSSSRKRPRLSPFASVKIPRDGKHEQRVITLAGSLIFRSGSIIIHVLVKREPLASTSHAPHCFTRQQLRGPNHKSSSLLEPTHYFRGRKSCRGMMREECHHAPLVEIAAVARLAPLSSEGVLCLAWIRPCRGTFSSCFRDFSQLLLFMSLKLMLPQKMRTSMSCT